VHYAAAAGRFTHEGYLIWVASKEVDVVLYPLNSEALVVKSCVRRAAFLLERGTREPAHCAEPIVHRYVHDSLAAVCHGRVDKPGRVVGAALLFRPCNVPTLFQKLVNLSW